MNFSVFEKRIGVVFKDKRLLVQALTHRSFLGKSENRSISPKNNERLEFLGDAILGAIITDYLFKKYEDKAEGNLTEYRSALVNINTLGTLAKEIGINEFILLSETEVRNTNARTRIFILGNALEALIGALFTDQGFDATQRFVISHFLSQAERFIKLYLPPNSKGRLQEIAQDVFKVMPRYKVLKQSGPSHNKHFVVGVYFGSELIATGQAGAKKLAEAEAASAALERMRAPHPTNTTR